MDINKLPEYDMSDNPTGCCPRFKPSGWDDQELHFRERLFVRAKTRLENHVPIDMGPVFEKTFAAIRKADAYDPEETIIMSRDISPSEGEHLFAVSKDVPGEEMIRLTGNYITKVFEGPFQEAPEWEVEMRSLIEKRGSPPSLIYYFYTTCPKCAETYGKNYVIGIAEVANSKS